MPLTAREQQVFEGLLRGATSKQIARDLGIAPRTADTHRSHVLAKLNAKTTVELLARKVSGREDPSVSGE